MTEKYTTHYTVTIGDINYGGHLGNDRALVIFQDARIRFLRSLNCSEKDIGEGAGLIMVETGVRYHREVFLHDELIVNISLAVLQGKKFVLEYEVSREADNQQVLSGFTSFLAFDYQRRKVVKLPGEFLVKVHVYLQAQVPG